MRSVVLILLSSILCSAPVTAQISVAPELGANVSNYVTVSNGDYSNGGLKGSIRIGVRADVPLCTHFHFMPGLLYENNGVLPPRMAGGSAPTLTIHTIDAPLHVIYRLKTGHVTTPFFGFGPYVAANIGGTSVAPGFSTFPVPPQPEVSRSLKIGSATGDDIKRFDAGVSTTIGLQLPNGLYAAVLFQGGLVNLLPDGDRNNSMKNVNAAFSLGYFFRCARHAGKSVAEKK